MNQQNNHSDRKSNIGNIKRPPSIDFIAENIYVKKIEIEEIDHLAQSYPVDDIAYGAAGDSGHRVSNYFAAYIRYYEIKDNQKY